MSNDSFTFGSFPHEQGRGCGGCIKHLTIIAGALILTCLFICLVYTLFLQAVIQDVPATTADLCRIVGLNPETEPVCHKTESWRSVLQTAFPLKVATIKEVHAALGPYREYSMPTSYGTHESFRIAPGLLGPVITNFSFNEAGILESITIED
jgi:hypothetical protein